MAYIESWEKRGYEDGIPEEAPMLLESANRVPSYRKICICIMKNDMAMAGLGYTIKRGTLYNQLKRIELSMRGNTVVCAIQYDMFGGMYG